MLRQPFADLAELAARKWLPCYLTWSRINGYVADLRARLAVAELALDRIGDALEEADDLIEGEAALSHARAKEPA